MFKKTLTMTALTCALMFAGGFALAADQDRTRLQDKDLTKDQIQDRTRDQDQDKIQDRTRDRIFGSQLMTEQERNQYLKQISSAKTAQERAQIRAEHHERMLVRAKERGVTLPDVPPARGGGMGNGMGSGMGMSGAMGSGGKR